MKDAKRSQIFYKKLFVTSLTILLITSLGIISVFAASTFETQTVVSAEEVRQTSIFLDTNNRPHISYTVWPSDIKYASWTGSEWQIQAIDNEPCSDASLALDPSGTPHISYYETSTEDLKYAVLSGSNWTIQTVDTQGNVGNKNSIAVDSTGKVHISYQDVYSVTSIDLKYAVSTSSVTQTPIPTTTQTPQPTQTSSPATTSPSTTPTAPTSHAPTQAPTSVLSVLELLFSNNKLYLIGIVIAIIVVVIAIGAALRKRK